MSTTRLLWIFSTKLFCVTLVFTQNITNFCLLLLTNFCLLSWENSSTFYSSFIADKRTISRPVMTIKAPDAAASAATSNSGRGSTLCSGVWTSDFLLFKESIILILGNGAWSKADFEWIWEDNQPTSSKDVVGRGWSCQPLNIQILVLRRGTDYTSWMLTSCHEIADESAFLSRKQAKKTHQIGRPHRPKCLTWILEDSNRYSAFSGCMNISIFAVNSCWRANKPILDAQIKKSEKKNEDLDSPEGIIPTTGHHSWFLDHYDCLISSWAATGVQLTGESKIQYTTVRNVPKQRGVWMPTLPRAAR